MQWVLILKLYYYSWFYLQSTLLYLRPSRKLTAFCSYRYTRKIRHRQMKRCYIELLYIHLVTYRSTVTILIWYLTFTTTRITVIRKQYLQVFKKTIKTTINKTKHLPTCTINYSKPCNNPDFFKKELIISRIGYSKISYWNNYIITRSKILGNFRPHI